MEQSPEPTRRAVLRAAGVAAGVGLAGCSTFSDAGPSTAGTASRTSTSPTSTATPTSDTHASALGVGDTASTYAVLGSEEARETATLYGSWKCPYTAEFVTEMFPAIADAYVEPGALAVEFRGVRYQNGEPYGDDEPRSLRAGLAVWNEYPDRFPAYLQAVFSSQPSDTTEWATVDQLLTFARQAGIDDTDGIEAAVRDGRYTERWKETMTRVREAGIEGVPRLALGGEITAPILDPDATERQLRRALE